MNTLAEYGRQILSLIVVFSLLGATVWKLGRQRGDLSLARLGQTFLGKIVLGKTFTRTGRSEERVLERVERLALTPQHTLHVLRLHGRELVVATHSHGCTLLECAKDGPDGDRERLPGLAFRGARAGAQGGAQGWDQA